MSQVHENATMPGRTSTAVPWLRALELTKPIASHRDRIFSTVIHELASLHGGRAALLSDGESYTYCELSERANQYARWALGQDLEKGDVVCLLMSNRPEYLAAWLGITSTGVVVSLLNTHLTGRSLAHCIAAVSPKSLIMASEFAETLAGALPHAGSIPTLWTYGAGDSALPRIDLALCRYSVGPLSEEERRQTSIDDLALYIYTSGTTGLPKAARVTHGRIMQWTHWFAGMMQAVQGDRMYDCLPMYHSVGGVQAPGAVMVAGGAVVIRDKFSVTDFWNDIVRWDCTIFQYIGELCRYLVRAPFCTSEIRHRIRLACGNGLAAEVWGDFAERFNIPQILEFYAATEGNISLFNVPAKRGSIGQVPGYLAHRFGPALVRFDFESGEPMRDSMGFCVPCEPNQIGEALGSVVDDAASLGRRFDGYRSTEDTDAKVLRDVFVPGDAWIRSGDLMRKDVDGFFYFVDRAGDSFRRKGENVATYEVAAAISEFPGISHAVVYGVAVPGADGRVGMAALVADHLLDLGRLHDHLGKRLPAYARPVFLRVRASIDVTGTFKYSKTELVSQGFNPRIIVDPLYFDSSESNEFVILDAQLYGRIQEGSMRL